MTSARLSMRLDPNLKNWLEQEAKRQDRSAGYLAKKAIEAMKLKIEAKDQLIQDAIAKADKGAFVSQQAVHSWMESWDTENERPQPRPDVFLKRS